MRLFIAITLDGPARERLMALQEALRPHAQAGHFSEPEHLHLTLAFLGEVSPTRLPLVEQVMEESVQPAFDLKFGRLGCFHHPDGDTWWVGAQSSLALTRLQRSLCTRLAKEGFPIESRLFTPHLTLARQVILDGDPPQSDARFTMHVGSISLMLSERISGVLTYTPQHHTLLPAEASPR